MSALAVAAICRSAGEWLEPEGAIAVKDADLQALCYEVDSTPVPMTRGALMAHRDLAEAAAQVGAVPVAFGTTFDDPRQVVSELIAPRRALLRSLLDQFEASVEFRVEGEYLDGALLGEAARSRTVQRLRRLTGLSAQVALGEAVAEEMGAIVAADIDSVSERLSAFTCARSVLQSRDHDKFAVAVMVRRTALSDFEKAVATHAGETAARIGWRLVGPVAPWDFVGPAFLRDGAAN